MPDTSKTWTLPSDLLVTSQGNDRKNLEYFKQMNQKTPWLRECSCIWHVLGVRWLVHEVTVQKVTRTRLNEFFLLSVAIKTFFEIATKIYHIQSI